jgi:hypothetical protein
VDECLLNMLKALGSTPIQVTHTHHTHTLTVFNSDVQFIDLFLWKFLRNFGQIP